MSNPRRIAVATSLSKMINYMATGEAFYSVAEASFVAVAHLLPQRTGLNALVSYQIGSVIQW